MSFNDKKYLDIVEHKRNLVITTCENYLTGSTQTSIPALFLIGTAEEIKEKWGFERVVELDNLSDMFILGLNIGQKGKKC